MASCPADDQRLVGRPRRHSMSSSHLPQLVELVIAAPLVTTEIVAGPLSVTPRAALGLVTELGSREITGRGRFRARTIA